MGKKIQYSTPELIDLSFKSAQGDCASGTNITVGDCASGFQNDNDCLSGNQAGLGNCSATGLQAVFCATGAVFT
jgi:hypothetical protein